MGKERYGEARIDVYASRNSQCGRSVGSMPKIEIKAHDAFIFVLGDQLNGYDLPLHNEEFGKKSEPAASIVSALHSIIGACYKRQQLRQH